MTRAFIVHLNVDDGFVDPVALAEDIQEDLVASGHDVVSVAMWTAPTLAANLPSQSMFQSQFLPPT